MSAGRFAFVKAAARQAVTINYSDSLPLAQGIKFGD
jgi:hypothetical protein